MTDDEIIDGILVHEGGYVNHPADRGGPTNFGITQTTLARWRNGPVSVEDVQALTVEEARSIYRALYVTPFLGVAQDIKPHVVDIAVHSGPGRARQLLALAERPRPGPSLGSRLVLERLEFFADLVKKDPTQAVFLKGWIRRAGSFLALAVLVCGCAKAPVVLPTAFADCTIVRRVQQSVYLACPANESYTLGPLLGPKVIELDLVTHKVIRTIPSGSHE